MAGEHRIGRLRFELTAPHQAALGELPQQLRQRFEALILPVLQQALDQIDREGRLLMIERIELDLGSFAAGQLDAESLARELASQLVAALDSQISQPAPARCGEDALADQLILFLRSGELPWSQPGAALQLLLRQLLALDGYDLRQLASRLKPLLIRRDICLRVAQQLPASLCRRLLVALAPEDMLLPLNTTFGSDEPLASTDLKPTSSGLVPELASLLQRLASGLPAVELGELIGLYAMLASPHAIQPQPAASIRPQAQSRPALPVPTTAPGNEDDERVVLSRPVYAAGAVLLHPYLPMFFERLGLLAGPGEFRDEACRQRAVLLAHFLATGQQDAPEPETTLFKLLCGLPLNTPIPRSANIQPQEQQEAEALLRSVISHWGKLGNTSPDGLREGFLTRSGLLQPQGQHWRLQVETSGIDILLQDLPWTLSRVRTPFMASLLTVEWR